MRRVCAVLLAVVLDVQTARADGPATVSPQPAGEIGEAEVEAARERAEARRAAVEQRAAEDRAAAKAAQDAERARVATAQVAAAREQQRERRNSGWLLVGTGAGTLALSGVFTWLSNEVNKDIRNGVYDYDNEITSRAVDGQIYNALAWTFGVIGVIAVGVGVPVVLTTKVDDVPIQVAPAVTDSGAGLSITGTLP